MSHEAEPVPAARPRAELLRRRASKEAWIAILIGLIVPFVAVWGVRVGWHLRKIERWQGNALMLAGTTVFVGRLALYVLR